MASFNSAGSICAKPWWAPTVSDRPSPGITPTVPVVRAAPATAGHPMSTLRDSPGANAGNSRSNFIAATRLPSTGSCNNSRRRSPSRSQVRRPGTSTANTWQSGGRVNVTSCTGRRKIVNAALSSYLRLRSSTVSDMAVLASNKASPAVARIGGCHDTTTSDDAPNTAFRRVPPASDAVATATAGCTATSAWVSEISNSKRPAAAAGANTASDLRPAASLLTGAASSAAMVKVPGAGRCTTKPAAVRSISTRLSDAVNSRSAKPAGNVTLDQPSASAVIEASSVNSATSPTTLPVKA